MYSDQHHVVWAPGYASGWKDNYSKVDQDMRRC